MNSAHVVWSKLLKCGHLRDRSIKYPHLVEVEILWSLLLLGQKEVLVIYAGVFLETCVSGIVKHCLATVWLLYNVAGILANQLLLLLLFLSNYYISKVHETLSHKSKVSYLKCVLGLCRYHAALIENAIYYAATALAQRSSKMTASLNKYYSFSIHLISLTLMFILMTNNHDHSAKKNWFDHKKNQKLILIAKTGEFV